MASREYTVDVAAYQSSSMTAYHSAGAKNTIIKLTEGTGYFNPKASAQIKSAHENHMFVHGYHFATFGNSVNQAKAEAKVFVSRAKTLNVSKKRYLWLDWETGDGNVVVNSRASNTRAILAFMGVVYDAGYKAGLYSGASLMRSNIDTSQVVRKYGTCLWVASYATMGRIDAPNFGYFPSMDGVALWQFTDNWCGLNVDGNISLIDLHPDSQHKASTGKPAPKEAKPIGICYVPVINGDSNWHVRLLDYSGHYTQYIATNTKWKVWDTKTIKGMKCYKIGNGNQWLPAQFARML